MTTFKTIVFGPTGNVGSATARSAQQQGAKVVLAMRDPQKPIPGLSVEQEAEGGFERIQADLTKPETIAMAVNQTGAKHAFIYAAFGTSDNMRSCITALKSAGIKFVVFLSSDGIQSDIRSVPQSDFIAWAHAQVEVNLDEIFGPDGFVAVRPNYFASNALWWKKMISEGEVKMAYPDAKFDWITPEDIGRLCGTLLARGLQVFDGTDKNIIHLCGPELVSQRDAVGIIGRAIGQNINITELDAQEGLEMYVKGHGLPEPVAKRLIEVLRMRTEDEGSDKLYHTYKEAKDNVMKYTGGQSTRLHEWVDENKQKFSA
jgi:uncharacterized protein YbjT (DUF2867 family)